MIYYELCLSKQAEVDVKGMFDYISFILLSSNESKNKVQNLENGIRNLNSLPERFVKYDKEPWCSRGIRKMMVENTIVFYHIDTTNKIVTVLRVVYSARDMDSVFRVVQIK